MQGWAGMATTLFKDTTYSAFGLIEDIKQGEVALLDIQRPFVWGASKVRGLLDSMYEGFPVGFLMFWETGAEAGARQIGVDANQKVPRMLVVDGQQRLTSLYTVMTGSKVVRDDYSEGRVRIAFRPADAMFAVADTATDKDPGVHPGYFRVVAVPALHVPCQLCAVTRSQTASCVRSLPLGPATAAGRGLDAGPCTSGSRWRQLRRSPDGGTVRTRS
jgi:hypothetical protein